MTGLKVYLTVADPVGQTAFFELTYAQLLLNLSWKSMRKVPLLRMSLCEYYLAMGSFQLYDYLKKIYIYIGIIGGVLRANITNLVRILELRVLVVIVCSKITSAEQ